jgi:predicted nucleotidyltransferase
VVRTVTNRGHLPGTSSPVLRYSRGSKARGVIARRSGLEDLYGANVVGIRLFGSYARRQATPDSDVDDLIVLREVGDYGTEVRRVSDLLPRVSLQYGKTIAPVFVDAQRFSAAADPFMANLAREAVPA